MKKLNVVGAIIIEDKKVFSALRGESKNPQVAYKYEFVGGKIEAGESGDKALKRELLEEMSLDVDVLSKFMTVIYDYEMYQVELTTYICKRNSNYIIKEHLSADWLSRSELNLSQWAPADEPILQKLLDENYL